MGLAGAHCGSPAAERGEARGGAGRSGGGKMGGAPRAAGGTAGRTRRGPARDDLWRLGQGQRDGAGNLRCAAGRRSRCDRGRTQGTFKGPSGWNRPRALAQVARRSRRCVCMGSGGNVTAGGRTARKIRHALAANLGGLVRAGLGSRIRGDDRGGRGMLLERLVGFRPPPLGRHHHGAGKPGRAGLRHGAGGGGVDRATGGFAEPGNRRSAGDDHSQGKRARLRHGGPAGYP